MEMVLAWRYGASGAMDAFRIASLVVVLGNQLFFGYLLPNLVIPLFSEYRAKGMEYEGWRLAFSIAVILCLISFIFVLWVWIYPNALVGLLGPGLAARDRDDTSLLMRYFSMALLLMVWSGVISGILYVYRVFWLSAVAQLLPNLFVILAVFVTGSELGIGALALGLMLGYAAMLGLFVYALIRIARGMNIRLLLCMRLGPLDGLLETLRLSLPLMVTILIGQWGIIIINRALSEMPSGTLAEFGYAWKLLSLINLLPVALATVIFPAFADAHATNNSIEFSRLAMRAFRMTLFLTLPLAGTLIVERLPIVTLLFGRGGMSMASVAETSELFGILLLCAPAGALSATLCKIAFSMGDTKLPTVTAFISTFAISWCIPFAAEVGSVNLVAWAYVVITWLSTLLILGYQIFRYRIMSFEEVMRYFGSLILLCIGVAVPAIAIRHLFELYIPITLGIALVEALLIGWIFIFLGYIISIKLGINESAEIHSYFKWQLKKIIDFKFR